jgi:hypothetical protein
MISPQSYHETKLERNIIIISTLLVRKALKQIYHMYANVVKSKKCWNLKSSQSRSLSQHLEKGNNAHTSILHALDGGEIMCFHP